jgi:hypothetical protein
MSGEINASASCILGCTELSLFVKQEIFSVSLIEAALNSMSPNKVSREKLKTLTDLPNIGKAGAKDLNILGIYEPDQLIGKCPYEMYYSLCDITGANHDPCVLDVFISITRFMDGENPRPWWAFTQERKDYLGGRK